MRKNANVSSQMGALSYLVGALIALPLVVAIGAFAGWVIEWWFPTTSAGWMSLLLPWENLHLYQLTALLSFVLFYLRSLASTLALLFKRD